MSFESFVTKRYLKIKHQQRVVPMVTVLATLGVAVGVMVLVVVIAVMTGFQSELKNRILGVEAHMVVMRYNEWIGNADQVVGKITATSGVQSAAPFVYTQGMLRSAKGVSGVQLRGIDPKQHLIHVPLIKGNSMVQLLQPPGTVQEAASVVLGKVLAEKLNLKVGDGVMLMAAGSRETDPRALPQIHRLKVVGLFETGMHQYDGNMGFMNIQQMQRLLGVTNLVTGIGIRAEDVDQVEIVADRVLEALGVHFWGLHWKQMHRNLFSMLALQKIVMYVIMTLIILVAAFNIASALIMMVREKTRDIAILKAMGATHKSLRKIFMRKGIVIGLAGILIGLCFGLMACWLLAQYHFIDLPGDVYFLTTLPVQIDITDIVLIVCSALTICVCASWYPARQAARMNPVDAIRYR